jgi:large conductance mechanosensitive channel
MWEQLRKMNPKIVVEFKDFLLKTNMFALAMAVVIGGAIQKAIEAIVGDIIMPTVGIVLPGKDWRSWPENSEFKFGHLGGAVIDFVIIAAVVFFVTKLVMKPTAAAAAPAPAPSKVCPQCMETIHPDAKKCKFCTSPM